MKKMSNSAPLHSHGDDDGDNGHLSTATFLCHQGGYCEEGWMYTVYCLINANATIRLAQLL